MKKLLLSSLLVFPILTTSCIYKPNNSNNSSKIITNKQEKFYDNKNINNLLDLYLKGKQQKQIYALKQENISDAKINDLKFVLTFYTVFNNNRSIESVTTHYQQVALKAKKTLKNTLSNDWYWLLKHINQFDFNFNPYDDSYKHFKLEQNLIDYVYKTHNNLLTKINDKYPDQVIVFNINDIKDLDSLKNKQAIYLVYDKSKVLKILKYKKDNKIHFQVFTDLLWFKDPNNLKEQLEQIEKKIYEKRLSKFNEALKEYIEEERDESNDDENSEISEKLDTIWNEFIEKSEEVVSSKYTNLWRQLQRDLYIPNNTFIRNFTNKNDSIQKWKEQQLKNIGNFLEKNSNAIMDGQDIKKELEKIIDTVVKKLNSENLDKIKKTDGTDESQLKEKFLESYVPKNDDSSFYELHSKRQYNDLFVEALDEFNNIKRGQENKENNLDLKVIRYSMRNIYEKK
ncbi:lipoprotein [Mycoplasma feriruminatoris]|uniref:aromatic motif membrane protein n=1 Tax=Mycoplasma feriruminatoris TaxID=1179777 RepID=UPI00241F1019|nr:aromatic motif membrane protein [Mycoplasma feriruminatoris]WFQ91381.1 lipoprotein [Mycoplasma feriruminatoris]